MKSEKTAEYQHRYYEKNKEKIRAYRLSRKEQTSQYMKDYWQENREIQIQRSHERYNDPEKRLIQCLGSIRKGEKVRTGKIEFNLRLEDLKPVPEICPYLRIKLTHIRGKGHVWTNSTIDRIDNTKGYIPGNVRIISRLANTMKAHSTREQRETFAKAILNDPTL